MKRIPLLPCITGLAALALTSCFEIDQRIVLNPDGSGKVVVNAAVAMPDLGGLGGLKDPGAKEDPKAGARDLAVGLMRSEGIEQWSDVKYEIGKDGKTRASATGYFADVTKVKLAGPMDNTGGNKALGVTKDKDGNWVFDADTMLSDAKKSSKKKGDDATTEKPKVLTDEQVDAELTKERQQWAGMKGFMGAFFEGIKVRMSIEGGGTITSATVFKKEGDNKASFEFTGKQILDTIDKTMQDDVKAKKLVREGKNLTDSSSGPEDIFGAVFGEGKPRVVLKPGTAAFDYKAEVAKAKAAETPEFKALLEDAKKPAKKSALNIGGGAGGGIGGDDDSAKEAAPPKKTGKIVKPGKVD